MKDLSNNPQCSACGAVMVAGDPWKCLSCEGTVPAVSDEQVKGISEDLRAHYDGYRIAALEREDGEAILICVLIERIARSEQALAALEARNKEANSYLKRYEERTMWGTDGDNDVKLARAALKGAS